MPRLDDEADDEAAEGKHGDADPEGKHADAESKGIMAELMTFLFESSDFQSAWTAFIREHVRKYIRAAYDQEEGKEVEHELAWTTVYNDYRALFEAQVEGFLEDKGFELAEFFVECRAWQDKGDAEQKEFVEMLLSSESYEQFTEMMLREASCLPESMAGNNHD